MHRALQQIDNGLMQFLPEMYRLESLQCTRNADLIDKLTLLPKLQNQYQGS